MQRTKTCDRCGNTFPATTEHFGENLRHLDRLQPHGRTCHTAVLALCVGVLIWMGTAACARWAPTPPPPPPPPAILASSLVDTYWRLEQVSYQGKNVAFGAAGPIHLLFDRNGGMTLYSGPCGRGTYAVTYLGETRYELANASYPDLTCRGSPRDHLYATVDALEATGAYEVDNEHLLLRGADAELYLAIDTP